MGSLAALAWIWPMLVSLVVGVVQAAAPPPQRLLKTAWRAYLRQFVQQDGRVIDHGAGSISTSEGQAYAMLRAVWMGDRQRFDVFRRWTRDNLQSGDHGRLPAWKWGPREDGSWGVLDENPAADADQWIAYALLLAASRWEEGDYRRQALQMLDQIWEREVAFLGDAPVMLPGPWARDQDPLKLNPSYFLTFAWRTFAREDPGHPWGALLDTAYVLLEQVMQEERLPPDWMFVDVQSAEILDSASSGLGDCRFGYEAFRLSWNLAADVLWYDEQRARRLLVNLAALGTHWLQEGWIPAEMTCEAAPLVDYEYLGLYGALLPAWSLCRPEDLRLLYEKEIATSWRSGSWGNPSDYYSQNWVWFGLALWEGLALPPKGLP